MQKNRLQKLRQIIALSPEIEEIFLSPLLLDEKRMQLRVYLSNMLLAVFSETDKIPPLEWIVCRDATWVMRNILTARSEELSGFSVLKYVDALLNNSSEKQPPLTADFLAELEHLLKGIQGISNIYKEKAPAFLRHSGRKAAKMRSTDLSRMARQTQKYLNRYPTGIDDDLVRIHSNNKQRLFEYFNISELEWHDWHWHTKNIIRDAATMSELVELSDEEKRAIERARYNKIPFGITPYYLSLMSHEKGSEWDAAIRAQVIPPIDYVDQMIQHKSNSSCSMDFMIEHDTSPIDGITRRYPNIVILKPILTCPQICVYCQRNWEIEDVYSQNAALSRDKLEKALQWIEDTPEINEVLITGGDPMLLPDDRIEEILSRLAGIDHVIRIRIGTRTFVTLPQRITDSLVRTITRFHVPGRREIVMVTHFEHPTEITPDAMTAVQKFRLFGVEVLNQLVYTFYNSRKFEAAALRQKLRLIGVTPYYTFNTKGKEETDRYRVPIARLLQEQQEEARLLPGTVRTDEIVFNVPRLGKNYLRGAENRDVIAILPDGRRVYEFHPWEKKLALVDTYVYTDVSIYQYLKRLRQAGEQVKDYETIWYYY
ncbi:KamA family radical SAM protein [Desulforhopalus singaporensis]|uniref:L-lysine 2,3-aminomutase n=1 Tax=Desulforhopalus singaporensis TaxID=91360 RepID=A0A1H0LYM8_9BACT|nr:KamA family radical SAM protein [Desulforhopalus singaporensis]SDO73308.1 L-lysine 2,3-aminomutase [Desulforhopalus singaporensis]